MEVEVEVTALGAFLQTVCRGMISRLVPDNMTRVYVEGTVLIRVAQGMFRRWVEMGHFRVLCRMQCNPIQAILGIA